MKQPTRGDAERIAASCAYFEADVGPIPEDVAAALPCFVWDMRRLTDYLAPVERVAVERLTDFLTGRIWRRRGDIPFTLSPAEVAANPQEHAEHIAQANDSDLAFPVQVICMARGWRLADGYHRLLKATLIGEREIFAHLVPESAIPDILADLETLPPPRGGRIYAI